MSIKDEIGSNKLSFEEREILNQNVIDDKSIVPLTLEERYKLLKEIIECPPLKNYSLKIDDSGDRVIVYQGGVRNIWLELKDHTYRCKESCYKLIFEIEPQLFHGLQRYKY